MNKEMMKKNLNAHVLLDPPALSLDRNGVELNQSVDDPWWLVQEVGDDGVKIFNPRSHHFRMLGYDHIHNFTSDGTKNGAKRGILTLIVQLIVQGTDVRVLPTRPGEPRRPAPPTIVETLVDFRYAETSGIQQRLISEGYTPHWVRAEQVSGLELGGTSRVVVELNYQGVLSMFKLRDGMVLMKRRG